MLLTGSLDFACHFITNLDLNIKKRIEVPPEKNDYHMS